VDPARYQRLEGDRDARREKRGERVLETDADESDGRADKRPNDWKERRAAGDIPLVELETAEGQECEERERGGGWTDDPCAKNSSQNEDLSRQAALDCALRRPRSHANASIIDGTSAPCVLASHRPSRPGDEAPF
jgi:hypothetical protein